ERGLQRFDSIKKLFPKYKDSFLLSAACGLGCSSPAWANAVSAEFSAEFMVGTGFPAQQQHAVQVF
ncbi:MAG: hypothetical protein KDD53_11750, partial [Bdellovibrionales bacterium]|nr:hypothetical protein [Bdellovibrionales bacterium]